MSGFVTPSPSTEPADQPNTTEIITGGDTSEGNAAAEKLLLPSGASPFYVFSMPYQCVFNGQVLAFRPMVGYELDAALLAFLNALSAPITAV
jgi:hypothetical protein